MSDAEIKVLENRLRHAADRQGFRLQKSRARDPRAVTYSTYQLVDVRTGGLAVGSISFGYGLGLDDVERALFGEPVA
jgi:hypothetical protein